MGFLPNQNEKLILLYNHHLNELSKMLGSEDLANILKPLTEILYWRRKPTFVSTQ